MYCRIVNDGLTIIPAAELAINPKDVGVAVGIVLDLLDVVARRIRARICPAEGASPLPFAASRLREGRQAEGEEDK